jgi:hypothetical protein
MEKMNKYIVSFFLLMGCYSCQNRELTDGDPCLDKAVIEVDIHWDDIDPAEEPTKGMVVHLFSETVRGLYEWANLPTDVERITIHGGVPFFALCYDYYGNDHIYFRNDKQLDLFEAYSSAATGFYNSYGPNSVAVRSISGEENESTVMEPYPYNFFVARNADLFTALPIAGQVQHLHFYPQNVLREFTFLIEGVQGVKNIIGSSGAISGMSSTYRMKDGEKGSEPSTVLFGSKHGRVTWGGDSIRGIFCTFGPADVKHIRNRLTVEVISTGRGYYYGSWEDTVREQIAGALGEHGTKEEQMAWRLQNGGFDIVLQNDEQLVIPDIPVEGTFRVDVEDYDRVIVPLPLR